MEITDRETQVLDLRDKGLSIAAIAAQLGLKTHYVAAILNRFSGTGETSSFDRMVIAGSKALLAAIRRHHPEQFVEAR